MDFSIVVPTYNRPGLLQNTLRSFAKYLPKHDCEVIVCVDDDNNHAPESVAHIIEAKEEGLNIIAVDTAPYKIQGGWCAETYPLNVGIKKAQGEYILLNCGEVMMLSDVISVHKDIHFWAGRGGKELAVFSTVYFMSQGQQENMLAGHWMLTPQEMVDKVKPDDYCAPWNMRPLHFQMSIKRKHLVKMRGFDEMYYGSYGLYAGGDNDFSFRLKQMEIAFAFSDKAMGLHQWHPANKECSRGEKTGTDMSVRNKCFNVSPIRNVGWEWGEYPRKTETMDRIIKASEEHERMGT